MDRITQTLDVANHVFDVQVPERISKTTLEEFKEKLGANKPKKGKKGGKGKKKKKWLMMNMIYILILKYLICMS